MPQTPNRGKDLNLTVRYADIRRQEPPPRLLASTESSPPMILIKIAMVGVAIAAMMGVARDQRWPQRAGVVGVCLTTPAPHTKPDGAWYACSQGLMNGFPNLEADSCSSAGIVSHREIWNCDVPLVSLPGA